MIYERGDVVVALFPFTDIARARPRPCIVLSNRAFNEPHGAIIAAMITTAARSAWESDVEIVDLSAAGLKTRCVIRWKVFTLDIRIVARQIGRLSARDLRALDQRSRAILK